MEPIFLPGILALSLASVFLLASPAATGAEKKDTKKPTPIVDGVWIKAAPDRVFEALTEGAQLAKWWPKKATSEPRKGGKLVLEWFGKGGRMESRFERFEKGKEVSYPFYTEHLTFKMQKKDGGTYLQVAHRCGDHSQIHVAQCWGFLKANLKVYIEHGIDLRQETKDKGANK